jgi:hypothetical protein
VASNSIRLLDLFRYYKAGLPHQMAAITELEELINKANPNILGRNQSWFKPGVNPANNRITHLL